MTSAASGIQTNSYNYRVDVSTQCTNKKLVIEQSAEGLIFRLMDGGELRETFKQNNSKPSPRKK